jgi:hypothetical protein
MNWKKLFANEVTLHIKPLPNNLEVYGDFRISADVDKREVKANKPVNLTIDIMGQGNIEDIKKFELDIPNAVVYSDELKVSNSGITKGVVTQKIAIVADRDFTIPSLNFTYFDAKTKKPKTIKTAPIAIKVTGASTQAMAPSVVEEKTKSTQVTLPEKVIENNNSMVTEAKSVDKILWYLLGLISGIVLTLLSLFGFKKFQGREKKEMPIVKKIKKAKTDKALFELLLPYRDDDSVIKETLDKLEKNIYASGTEKIDRDEVLEYFEELI